MPHDQPMEPTRIEQAILVAMPGARVVVSNPSGDGLHLIGEVYWAGFKGKNRVEQHRLVYAALADLFAAGMHGLKLTTGVE